MNVHRRFTGVCTARARSKRRCSPLTRSLFLFLAVPLSLTPNLFLPRSIRLSLSLNPFTSLVVPFHPPPPRSSPPVSFTHALDSPVVRGCAAPPGRQVTPAVNLVTVNAPWKPYSGRVTFVWTRDQFPSKRHDKRYCRHARQYRRVRIKGRNERARGFTRNTNIARDIIFWRFTRVVLHTRYIPHDTR